MAKARPSSGDWQESPLMSDKTPKTDTANTDAETEQLAEDREHLQKRYDKDYDETSNDGDPDKIVGGELIP